MTTSSTILIDDIFYIPTVPRYKDLGIEMDDTLGDFFFELLTINEENIAPESKFEEPAKPSVRPNKRFSIDRKPSIKEVNEAKEESVTKVKAQPRPVRRSLMRQISKEPTQDAEVNVDVGEELPTELSLSQLSVPKPPLLTPKPAAATSIFSNVKPAFVQPPMRFGNTTQRRSVMPE
ncbi:hypothetical protein Mgra_00000282 [Meloidogyne graminicola]|uniref:Uncharacterized protein n=1 Tax=Meloidogyne graminicola TaxID=189291 RepID=A0A8T0A2Y4_9BILA|nr:hypothetical protein Mgra_00000282 [Meloidogyne graminicola]